MQEEHFLLAQGLHIHVNQLDHAQHAMSGAQRHADDRLGLPARHFVEAPGEPRVVRHVWDDQRLTVLGDPPGDAFTYFHARIGQHLGRGAYGDGEVQIIFLLIHHQQRPGFRAEVFRHLFHDGLQDGIQVERGRQSLRHIVEDGELLRQASWGCARCLRHALLVLVGS